MLSSPGQKINAVITFCLTISMGIPTLFAHDMHGPLRVSPINPRYFTNDLGHAVYLTGSHTWDNLVDMGPKDPPKPFNYQRYIQWMTLYNHNFIRLWAWDLLNWDTRGNREDKSQNHTVTPHPWQRTGPRKALDGKPKFDLQKINPEYLDRIRSRVKLAREHNIYVAVMLFEGWGLQFSPGAFENHPFHPANNINGINGDANGDGIGTEIHTLVNDTITGLQENYVRQVIETVNPLDNVLYEISNENHGPSTDWQYHMIRFIKETQKTLPKQHPVGMTFQHKGGTNQILFDSPAEWISPNREGGYHDNPPLADGSKVVITDTDHLWGIGGSQAWVWKSFLRGLNPIFMDCYDGKVLTRRFDLSWAEPVRKSMGHTLTYARRMDLIHMTPNKTIASSGYCLANSGKEYLIYLPDGQEVTVNLIGVNASFTVEWFNPTTGQFKDDESVTGSQNITLTSPFTSKDTVLYLRAE